MRSKPLCFQMYFLVQRLEIYLVKSFRSSLIAPRSLSRTSGKMNCQRGHTGYRGYHTGNIDPALENPGSSTMALNAYGPGDNYHSIDSFGTNTTSHGGYRSKYRSQSFDSFDQSSICSSTTEPNAYRPRGYGQHLDNFDSSTTGQINYPSTYPGQSFNGFDQNNISSSSTDTSIYGSADWNHSCDNFSQSGTGADFGPHGTRFDKYGGGSNAIYSNFNPQHHAYDAEL